MNDNTKLLEAKERKFQEVLKHFRISHYLKEGSVQCYCPAHADKTASLTISKGTDSIILKCHAGCSFQEIIEAVGLSNYDFSYIDKRPAWQKFVENYHNEQCTLKAIYDYYSVDSLRYHHSNIRLSGYIFEDGARKKSDKVFRQGVFTFNNGVRCRFKDGVPNDEEPCLYGGNKGLESALRARDSHEILYICEGEKDVDTLFERGYAAVTCGSANSWKSSLKSFFKNADVVILADNDDAGNNFSREAYSDIMGVAKSIKIIRPFPIKTHGDVTDYFESDKSNLDFDEMVKDGKCPFGIDELIKMRQNIFAKGNEALNVAKHYRDGLINIDAEIQRLKKEGDVIVGESSN